MGIVATIERRSATGAAADTWYYPGGFFYGGVGSKTNSGSAVSEFNALQLAVVWACVKILSEDSASLPLHLYRRRKGGGKDKAWADDRYGLMHDSPNPEMTAMSFRETFASHLLTWGNSYGEKEYTSGRIKKLVAIWPITPNRVTVSRNRATRKIEYEITLGLNGNVILGRDQILHVPGLSFDGLIGYSPIAAAREAIGMGKSLEEYGALYFGQGINPSVIVSHPGTLSTQAHSNLESSLAEKNAGLGKAHRLMLLDEGMKIEKLGIPNDDAQFLETRSYTNLDIGTRIFRLFPQQYGEYNKASTYASAEQFAIDYVTKVLRSWLVRLEQAYNFSLLEPYERGTYFFEHNIEGMLRGDIVSRYTASQIARRNGVINADEWREIENMNPIADGSGQKYVVERNMIDVADLGKEFETKPEPVGVEDETGT